VLAGIALLGRFDWLAMRFGRGEAGTLLSTVFLVGQILALEEGEHASNRSAKIMEADSLSSQTCLSSFGGRS
jgi:hypothetical protein